MRRLHSALGLATLATVLVACADEPMAPDTTSSGSAPQLSRSGFDLEAPRKHLVVFNGRAPKDFETRVEALGGTVTLNHHLGIAVVQGLADADAAALQRQVRAEHVEPMAKFELIEPAAVEAPTAMAGAAVSSPSSSENPAGATYFRAQWNMRQVNAPAAWEAGRLGSENVTVAILDTGIDYLLPDLAGRVDLDRSASFEPLDDLYAAIYYPHRHPSTDLHYHGTNVATQVASNAAYFAGVTSKTTLMSVKVCSFFPGRGCSGVFEGILYAIDNGADVINMSLGGAFQKSANPGAVAAFSTIMNYAKQQGVTMVVSAGNDEIDLDHELIPVYDDDDNFIGRAHVPSLFAMYCDATHVICVSATRGNDEPASYTNYGRSAIDVAAPGGVAGEWVYSLCPQTSLLFDCTDEGSVIGVAGTSQAAPHVAGLAALAVEDVGRNPSRVRAYIRNSADAIGGGNTAFYGKGRINVGKAVGAD